MFSDRKAGYIPDPGPSSFSISPPFPPRLAGRGRLGRRPRDPCWSAGALTTGRATVGRRAAAGWRPTAVGSAVSYTSICCVHIAHSGRWRHTGMNGKLCFNSMDELTFLSFSTLAVPGQLHGYKELANSALK